MNAGRNAVRLHGPDLTGDSMDLVKHLLDVDGFVYITGVPDSFDYVAELGRLGPILPQYGGVLIRDVRPLRAIGNDVLSASNTRELTPHTEWYEFPGLPPRYVALWCVQPAVGSGGETTLADGYRFLRQFSAAEQMSLRSRIYVWRSSPSLVAAQGVCVSARHAAIEEHGGRIVLRFSTHDITSPDDGILGRYISEGNEYFTCTKMGFRIARKDVLLWDNWRMMHARNAFTDRNRHLRRVLIGERGS